MARGSLPLFCQIFFDLWLTLGQQIQHTYGVQGPEKRFRTLVMPLNPDPEES